MSDAAATAVTNELRRRIVAAQLAADTPLREVALAKEFGVSRVPIREALRILTAEGFVTTQANVGSRVSSPPYSDAAELFDLRIVLEVALVRSAAEGYAAASTAEAETAERIRTVERDIETALVHGENSLERGDSAGVAEANLLFHQGIAELSSRPVLVTLLQQIGGRVEWMHAAHKSYTAGKRTAAWDEHREIFRLVQQGQADQAARVMAAHLRRSRDGFLASLAPQS